MCFCAHIVIHAYSGIPLGCVHIQQNCCWKFDPVLTAAVTHVAWHYHWRPAAQRRLRDLRCIAMGVLGGGEYSIFFSLNWILFLTLYCGYSPAKSTILGFCCGYCLPLNSVGNIQNKSTTLHDINWHTADLRSAQQVNKCADFWQKLFCSMWMRFVKSQ